MDTKMEPPGVRWPAWISSDDSSHDPHERPVEVAAFARCLRGRGRAYIQLGLDEANDECSDVWGRGLSEVCGSRCGIRQGTHGSSMPFLRGHRRESYRDQGGNGTASAGPSAGGALVSAAVSTAGAGASDGASGAGALVPAGAPAAGAGYPPDFRLST